MQIRILEATANIPIGTTLEVSTANLRPGGIIRHHMNGTDYEFEVVGVRAEGANRYRVWNSNVVVLIEVIG